MRVFVLRARKGPTTAERVPESFGPPSHFEVICHSLANALYVSQGIRDDVVFHLVLEGGADAPKIVTFNSGELYYLGGFDEKAMAAPVALALKASRGLPMGSTRPVAEGLNVARQSFERLVRGLAQTLPTYLLSEDGEDIRSTGIEKDGCFLFTDHIPMQKKTLALLTRLGVQRISLGPRILYASHCMVLVHNELDRRVP
jgi:tRNA (pseudouridine54-N1)-methyltransferase